MTDVDAVLFANDLATVAQFYCEVIGFSRRGGDDDHAVLDCHGFELIVHRIQAQVPDRAAAGTVAPRQTSGRIRLSFPVDNLDSARVSAAKLGGKVDDAPPPWASRDANFFLGQDPEGNVFGISERAR